MRTHQGPGQLSAHAQSQESFPGADPRGQSGAFAGTKRRLTFPSGLHNATNSRITFTTLKEARRQTNAKAARDIYNSQQALESMDRSRYEADKLVPSAPSAMPLEEKEAIQPHSPTEASDDS